MTLNLKRVVASAIPLAVLASTSLASDAQQFGRIYHPFAVRPYATGAATLGGGATLPIPGYLGTTTLSSGSSAAGASGSLFGYYATVSGGLNVEYCATGSGKGKGVFDGASGTVNTPCSNAVSGGTATTFGFLPPSGTPKQNFPTLAGTDAPLASTDYSTYVSDHASPGEPVELPSIFGAIAIYYNRAGVSGHANITTTNLCGLYDGRITTFGQLFGTSDTTKFTPIYRSDGSGTTFNFSNHLATVCTGTGDKGNYNGSQTATGAVSPAVSAFPKLPATAVGESGNGGVVKEIAATANTVGYAEGGYLTGTLASNTNYATIDSENPITNLPEAATAVGKISPAPLTANVYVNQVTGAATTTSFTPRVSTSKCVYVVPPSAYAKPSAGYSILAVTYLLINSTGNGSAGASSLKTLETLINTPADFKGGATAHITTIDTATTATGKGTTGYASLPSTFNSTLKSAASSCIGA